MLSECNFMGFRNRSHAPQKNEYLCSFGRTGHGGHRPTLICLAHHMNSSFFTRHLTTPRPTLRVHLFNVVFFHKIHKPRNLNPQTTEFKSIFYGKVLFSIWNFHALCVYLQHIINKLSLCHSLNINHVLRMVYWRRN